jgi:hypothetical protein
MSIIKIEIEKEKDEKEKDEKEKDDSNIIKSIKINYIFYISIFICLYTISYYGKTNLIWSIITFIIVSFLGYIAHFASHFIDFRYYYNKLDICLNNSITKNKTLNSILNFIVEILDFHDKVHHDSSINKYSHNIINEFIGNFITQAGIFLIFKYLMTNLNYSVIILWGLMYSTIHIINYDIIKNPIHIKHHLDKNTNYGMDIWDIIFNTKYKNDNNDIENINHYSINTILLTCIIIFFYF